MLQKFHGYGVLMTNCALDFIKLSLGVTKKTKGVERMSNMQIHVASESNKY